MLLAKTTRDPKINSRMWVLIIMSMWLGLIATSYIKTVTPTSYWLTISSIAVKDTTFGACPIIQIASTVTQSFYGEWSVTVLKKTHNGDWKRYGPPYTGYSNYDKTTFAPTGSEICVKAMPVNFFYSPGTYKLHVHWRVLPVSGGLKEISAYSNPFSVTSPN